jgi:hypothetical protein
MEQSPYGEANITFSRDSQLFTEKRNPLPCSQGSNADSYRSESGPHPLIKPTVITVFKMYNLYINSQSCVGRYANVYVCGLQVLDQYWSPLATQQAVIAPFPLATLQQMTGRGDTACPVCLDDMRLFTARITPCSHIFHGQCLRKCIIQFGQCPLCKQPL